MFVYLLECADGTIYTGLTNNLERRFWQHKIGFGGVNYTKKHGVRGVLHTELYNSYSKAFEREKEIKTWDHNSKLQLAKKTLLKPKIVREWNNTEKKWKKLTGFKYFLNNEVTYITPPKGLGQQ